MAKPLNQAEIDEILDSVDSDLDDSCLDPDYNISCENTTESSSSEDDSEPRRSKQKKPERNGAYQSADKQDPPLEIDPSKETTRKRKCNKASWKKNVRKQRRSLGKDYVDTNGRQRLGRTPKLIDCTNCRYRCSEKFSEEQRADICKEYWQLGDYNRQKDFLLSRVRITKTQRERARGERKRRKREANYEYLLKIQGTKEDRVCKKFFLATLDIGHGPLDTALRHMSDSGTFCSEDKRGKHSPANKTDNDAIAVVRRHIESFPTIESHYTRKDTRRRYLDQSLSISKMYRLYKEECATSIPVKTAVHEKTYRRIFCNEYNLSFFHPKKDQCAKCTKNKQLQGDEKEKFKEEYAEHLRKKEEAQRAKAEDKARTTTESGFVSATFDLQSVLQIPSSSVSLMYYSRKLCAYNLCVYNAGPPNDAFCYCWSEVEGGRGSNEIATCVYEWLCQLPSNVTEVSLFSDTCGGQNRNQNVAAMFLYAVQNTSLQIITHNFLESGHSHMECDSMHAAIEHEKKSTCVYTMIDWVSIFRRARRRRPYIVRNLHHQAFYDFKQLAKTLITNKRRGEDNTIINWLQVRSLRFEKNKPGVILYRYNYSDSFKKLHVSGRGRPAKQNDLPYAYDSKIPISEDKKKDLMTLCSKRVIPEEVHSWYAGLPTSKHKRDQVPEPSVDDSGDDDEST